MSKIYDLQGYRFRVEAEKNCLTESIELLKELSANKHIFLFDGKQMNIKFDRILKEISTGLSFKKNEYKHGDFYTLNYICNDRCVSGKYNTIYADAFDRWYFDFNCENNKFDFVSFDLAVEKHLEYTKRQLDLISKNESKIEDLIAEQNAVVKAVDDFNGKLDYITGEFLRINR